MAIEPGLALGGLLGGFLVGLTGMGGGALLTPMLVFIFNVSPTAAVGSDLVASLVMKPIGGAVHWRHRTVRTDIVSWLCLGSIPGAFVGVGLMHLMPASTAENTIRVMLGIALLATASTMIIRDQQSRRRDAGALDKPAAQPVQVRRGATVLLGLIGGALVGFTSVGSGSLMIVVMSFLYPQLSKRELVGTDLVQAVPLVGAAAIGHLFLGDVAFGVTASLLVGALPGVFVGARLSSTGATVIVRTAMPAVLVASGLKFLGAF
ncbi:MAG: sulfite exporter TauE/SafE family protein [Microthrixaceae bacterium]|nr:sulfite exporter TauE/SafE family protein [Microthrixaceae bacterium]